MKWNVTITVPESDANPEPADITRERLLEEVGLICTESFNLDEGEYTIEVASEVPAEAEIPAERTGTEG